MLDSLKGKSFSLSCLVNRYASSIKYQVSRNEREGCSMKSLTEDGASVNVKDEKGKTSFHLACKNNHPDVAWLLNRYHPTGILVVGQSASQGSTSTRALPSFELGHGRNSLPNRY